MENNKKPNRKKELEDLERMIQILQKQMETKKSDQQIQNLLKKFEEEKQRYDEEEKSNEINFKVWQVLGIYGGLSGGLESAIVGMAVGTTIDLGLKYSNKIKTLTRSFIDIETFVNSTFNLIGRLNTSNN